MKAQGTQAFPDGKLLRPEKAKQAILTSGTYGRMKIRPEDARNSTWRGASHEDERRFAVPLMASMLSRRRVARAVQRFAVQIGFPDDSGSMAGFN